MNDLLEHTNIFRIFPENVNRIPEVLFQAADGDSSGSIFAVGDCTNVDVRFYDGRYVPAYCIIHFYTTTIGYHWDDVTKS